MPYLPLDGPMPQIAVRAIMLFPSRISKSRRQASDFEDYHQHQALGRFVADGGILFDDHKKFMSIEHTERERWAQLNEKGVAAGQLAVVLLELMQTDPEKASWRNAIRVVGTQRGKADAHASEKFLEEARRRFSSVIHLWCAWILRGEKYNWVPDTSYDLPSDFQCFLHEAEIIRYHLQQWGELKEDRDLKLDSDLWRVPNEWEAPQRKPDWPPGAGEVNAYIIAESAKNFLKSRGRPKKLPIKPQN